MCLFVVLLAFSPRAAALLWWLVQPGRWDTAFDSWIWPMFGILFLPTTTIFWVAVAPFGNVDGTDWLWLGLGVILDLMVYANSAYRGREQYYGSRTNY